MIPLGEATPRGPESSAKRRKHKKKDKLRETGKENASDENRGSGLAPLKMGRKWDKGPNSPGKSPTKPLLGMKSDLLKGSLAGNKALLGSLPKVERRGFDVEAKLFQQVQKEFEQTLARKRDMFDILDRAKHNAVIPLAKHPGQLSKLGPPQGTLKSDTGTKLNMKTKMVLPAIPAGNPQADTQEVCSSQGASQGQQVRTIPEVNAMLPQDFHELKQMMELHRDLKGQMARNKDQITRLQESGSEDAEMMDLLRQQSSHVVTMMKDVLDRMESYPEELWALYGAVEAYEKCYDNMESMRDGSPLNEGDEDAVGPQSIEEHREALDDIYGHILEGVQTFLAVSGAANRCIDGEAAD